MTRDIRRTGGIIAIIGGSSIIILAIINYSSIWLETAFIESLTTGIYPFITGSIALVGGILLTTDRKIGALLAICAGVYYFVVCYFMLIQIWLGGSMISATPIIMWPIHMVALAGGILGLNITFEA